MFSQRFSAIASLTLTTTLTTIGLLVFLSAGGLPQIVLAQSFSPPQGRPIRPYEGCDRLIQRLNFTIEQQRQRAGEICAQFGGRLTTDSVAALREILDPEQLSTFDQKVKEVESMIDYDCDRGDRLPRPNSVTELKCR
jgi:hypothetical protein